MTEPVDATGTAPSGKYADADEDLMERYRDGEAKAFEILYARHRAPLYRYIRRQCANTPLAEEVFQDVWMRLIAARERYQIHAKFTTYLYRIARNRLIDYYRRADHQPTEQYVDSTNSRDPGPDDAPIENHARAATLVRPEEALEGERLKARLKQALDVLPREQIDAFLLHEEAGMTLDEIAELTGVGRETVKSRLRYAVSKLRVALGDLKPPAANDFGEAL